ncbi:PAS domain-containing protein [Bacillus wiedmannii]
MHMDERMNLQVTSQVLQVMNNGIALISHDGIITCSNKLFCSMLHKKENEIIGEHISTIFPDRTKLVVNQNDSLYRYECRSGNQVLIVNESRVYQNETEYGSIAILESKRKSIQSLESIISRYESALNLLSECILGVNEQGIVNF